MTREETIKKIISYFEENEEIYNDCIEELDSYNGYLADDRYYNMEDLNDFYCNTEPQEILFRAFYGYDEDTSTEDNHTEFNPNREYFTFNGYGNFVSADYKDYSAFLDEYFVESLSENRNNLTAIDENQELSEMFDVLEEC